MRRAFVVRCNPYRFAISAAAAQIDSGNRERADCSLRHCSNRWLSSTKSGGIGVCCWDMSQLTLHGSGESRTIAESSLHNDGDEPCRGIKVSSSTSRCAASARKSTCSTTTVSPTERPQKDYTIPLQQYFDHNLKGAPAPAWMEKG